MGWRFRKSINLGLGFRINLSKSGIGYSWGFPGYRSTKMANGSSRTTYSLPGTGISYVEQNGQNNNDSNELYLGESVDIKNIPIEELKKNDPILKEINKVASLNRWANILLFMTLLVYFNSIFSLCLILGIILKILVATKKVELYYEFDDNSRNMYNALKEALIIMSNSKKIWQINSLTEVYNTKYNAGARNNITRNSAFITSKMPWFIKTNINIYGFNLRNQKMFFTPDRILIFRPFGKVFGCTYHDMYIAIDTIHFVESERIYSDSKVVDYTWRYANKDGSRDLRFSANKKYPICEYGELLLKSPNGIKTIIDFSNSQLEEEIQTNLIIFTNQFNALLEKNEENEKTKTKEKNSQNFTDKPIQNTNIQQTKNKDDKKAKDVQKSKPIINKQYKLPEISILMDEESKSILPFIEKIQKTHEINLPIGIEQENVILESINSMPNLLIGGTVMSGKTTYINTILGSILLTKKPHDIKLIIFDSKKVDYSIYNGLPHLLWPVITNNRKLDVALERICSVIEDRTEILKEYNVKNIDLYNKQVDEDLKIPTYLLIIDDISSLNMSEEISDSIEYITSNGWNVNVYVIVASNHPSAKVLPTVSKSNFPARLSFRVASSQASQIIINDIGAEKLKGVGTALYTSRLNSSVLKIKIPFITDSDIERIVLHCCEQQKAYYSDSLENTNKISETQVHYDPLYDEVLEFTLEIGKVSAPLLQRKFKLGYNRAARIIDLLEERGIIGPQNGSKPREVIIKTEDGE